MIDAVETSVTNMWQFLCRFVACENGSTSLEYTIMAAGIALAVVSSMGAMSAAVAAKYALIKNAMPG